MLSTASMPFAACDLWSVLNLLGFIPIYDGIYTKDLVKTMTIATSVKLWPPYTHADIGCISQFVISEKVISAIHTTTRAKSTHHWFILVFIP